MATVESDGRVEEGGEGTEGTAEEGDDLVWHEPLCFVVVVVVVWGRYENVGTKRA